MEETKTPDLQNRPAENGCIRCGSIAVMKGYPNALCEGCRDALVKFPIPLWIKIFAGGIGLILLFSLYKIPKNIGLGVHLEKGKTAFSEKRYLAAQRELKQVVKLVPGNTEAQGYLLMAAFHNEDFETMSNSFEALKDKEVEDQELFREIDNTLKKATDYFANDSLVALMHKFNDDFYSIPDDQLKQFIDKNNDNIYARSAYAARLSDKDQLVVSDSMLTKIIEGNPDYIPALDIMAGIKRQENQLEESITYCDQILSLNKESVYGLATKSRTRLKQKKDEEALKLATSALQLDENNAYAMGSLIMVYHFTNKPKEKEDLLKKISLQKDSTSVQTLRYIQDVMSGKEPFRN